MSRRDRLLGRVVRSNNRRILGIDAAAPNLRATEGVAWSAAMVDAWPSIRGEWDRLADRGLVLPLIEDLIDEHQGNEGEWRAGLLVSRGRPCDPLASMFPATSGALRRIPGLRSALWSWMDAGTELPPHSGPNAGVLRYHLGVRCGDGAAVQVDDVVVSYRDGGAVLFDDTAEHTAWNRGENPRVTLFCEVLRPLPWRARIRNRAVQAAISLDPRYRGAPARAARLHRELNPA